MGIDFSKVDEVINRPTGMRVGTEFKPPEDTDPGIVKFGKRWFPAAVGLSENISYLLPEVKEARNSIERLRESSKLIGNESEQLKKTKESNLAFADELERTLPEKPTAAQVIANVAETAMYVYTPAFFKGLKAMPGLRAMATGGILGSAYGVTSGVRDKLQLEDILTRATMTGVVGAGLGIGGHLILDKGVFKAIPALYGKVIPTEAREYIKQRTYPILDILQSDFGEAGKNIAKQWNLTRADSGVIAGEPTLRALEVGITPVKVRKYIPLTEEEAWLGDNSLYDVLSGRADTRVIPKVEKGILPLAQEASPEFNAISNLGKENIDLLNTSKEAERLATYVDEKGVTRVDRYKQKQIETDLLKKNNLSYQKAQNEFYNSLNPENKIGDVVKYQSRSEAGVSIIHEKMPDGSFKEYPSPEARGKIQKVEIIGAEFDMMKSVEQMRKTGFPTSFKFTNLIGKNTITGESVRLYKSDLVNGKLLGDTIKINPESVLKEFISKQKLPKLAEGKIPAQAVKTAPEIPAGAVSERVQKAATVARDIYDTYGGMGEAEGILVGKRENYMNQMTPTAARIISSQNTLNKLSAAKSVAERESILLADKYKRPYLLNAVKKLKAFPTVESANEVLESWGQWVLDGGRYSKRSEKFISWLMNSERVTTMQEAQVLASGAFSDLIKPALEPVSGFMERHRNIDFPFFNPDPRIAVNAYIVDASSRLAYLKHFGKGGMSVLLKDIETTQGPQQMEKAELYVRSILGTVKKDILYGEEKAITSYLKALQTPKLSFSAITNLGQSLNTLLSSDMKSLGYGLKVAFTDKGFQEAMKSGAVLQSVMHKVLGYSGGGTRFGDAVLKYSGFNWSEMFNRIVASNSGGKYFEANAALLAKFPNNPILRARVEELGGDVAAIIARGGKLLEAESLRAMNIFSAKTQFLNDAASLPMFMSSPWGQVLFQFKNYAYNQTKFVMKELGTQWAQKNYGRLIRDLSVLGLAFPIYGEISGDIRATLTGAKRPKTFLARYFNSLSNAGAFGLAFDMWNTISFGKTAEFILGPSVSSGIGFLENFTTSIKQESIEPELKFIINQTGFGRILTGYTMPPKTKRKGYGQWWEFYEDLAK